VWEKYADRVQLFTDPRVTEPAGRLQLVFRLVLQSTVEFTLLRRGWMAAVRQQVGCLGTRGSCGRKESGGEIQQEQDIYNILL